MTGGASRADVESLVILMPVSIVICGVALFSLSKTQAISNFWALAGGGAITTLAALHVIPLPPLIWPTVIGNTDILEIDRLVGLPDTWRPLTLAPNAGRQALMILFTPMAILLLGAHLNRNYLFRLLPILIGLGILSAALGLLQIVGGQESQLYLYRITNNGSSVGLFANRNHSATLLGCLFPMLATFYSIELSLIGKNSKRLFVVGAIGIALVPLILVTGSRAGLVVAVMGLVGAALLYQQAAMVHNVGSTHKKRPYIATPVMIGIVVICMAFVTMYFSRAEAIERLFKEASGIDNRSDFWYTSVGLIWKYFPFGSGSGAFVEVYRVAEHSQLLDSTYLNRAHNDWIETAVTFSLPGLLLIVAGSIAYFTQSLRIWRLNSEELNSEECVSINVARMAGFAMAMLAVASFVDYPLRTPTMMSVFAVMILWFSTNDGQASIRSGQGVHRPDS